MLVKEIMSSNLVAATPEMVFQQAAERMRAADIGFLPLISENRLIGVVTDRDMVIKGLAVGIDPSQDTVRAVANTTVVCCYETDELEDAAKAMKAKQVRRLVVLDGNRKPVGVVSLGDLTRAMTNDRELISLFRFVSTPSGAFSES